MRCKLLVLVGCVFGLLGIIIPAGAQTIVVTSYPTTPVNARSAVRIGWRIDGLAGGLTHNHVHWAVTPHQVDQQYTSPHDLSAPFQAIITAPTTADAIYFRIHAIVNGRDIYSDVYTILVIPAPPGGGGGQRVATPQFDPPAPGSRFLIPPLMVTISCATPGATIRYTTDGSNPNETSPVYTSPLSITRTTTIKAQAYRDGMQPSAIAVATYTYDPNDRYERDNNLSNPDDRTRASQFQTRSAPPTNPTFPSCNPGEGERIQLRSIHPASDPDWVKFTFSPEARRMVIALTDHPEGPEEPPSVDQLWDEREVRDPVTRLWRVVPQQIRFQDNEQGVVSGTAGRIRYYYKPNLQPTGNRSDSERSQAYSFRVTASGSLEAYLLAVGTLPIKETDFYEKIVTERADAAPGAVAILRIGNTPDLVHIRSLVPTGDVDWAWILINRTPRQVAFMYVILPGATGTIAIEIYGPDGIDPTKRRYSQSVRLNGNSTVHSSAVNLTEPGVYYFRVSADASTIVPAYILKVIEVE
ncbi:MAG: chitobiase/beta-hexosaminidase C-terminal domain-containing protein [Thermoguttaceae bacterium]|nr:chitobiase/beta-hexosaminidase C-terminal domain-containing protein [Thermoguttaceae bacterium]MDW8038863.1 chitobiase/beta-hexosaminidase C-terminal domain-containing protein [Thermoguttaceae bacterium]